LAPKSDECPHGKIYLQRSASDIVRQLDIGRRNGRRCSERFYTGAVLGKWVGPELDRSVIELSAKNYVSDEANCTVDWVSETAGARGAIYSAHLHCFSPAQTTGERFVSNLIIWPQDDVRIAVGPDFMRLKIFRRCSATRPTRSDGARSEDVSSDNSRTSLGSGWRRYWFVASAEPVSLLRLTGGVRPTSRWWHCFQLMASEGNWLPCYCRFRNDLAQTNLITQRGK